MSPISVQFTESHMICHRSNSQNPPDDFLFLTSGLLRVFVHKHGGMTAK